MKLGRGGACDWSDVRCQLRRASLEPLASQPSPAAAGGTDLPSAPGPWLIPKPKHQDGTCKSGSDPDFQRRLSAIGVLLLGGAMHAHTCWTCSVQARASLQGNPSLLAAPRPRRAPQHPLGPPAHTIVLYCLVKYPVKLTTGDPSYFYGYSKSTHRYRKT